MQVIVFIKLGIIWCYVSNIEKKCYCLPERIALLKEILRGDRKKILF